VSHFCESEDGILGKGTHPNEFEKIFELIKGHNIAKNSIILYIRLIIVMVCGLFTSRIVLEALGASDYGLYNVVGGFVTIFTVITSSLSAATSRFITFELGRNDMNRLISSFSMSVQVHIMLSFILFLLLETVGVWYLNYKMVIEPERLTAANYALQFSIVTLMFSLMNVPYNAVLIAHEQMDFYAYVSIGEVFVKLGACLALPYIHVDSLIVYSLMLMVISIIVRIVYMTYCGHHFEECKFTKKKDQKMLKDMLTFSGWNFIGASSGILKDQGNNLVLNYFFGTVVNAAYGLTNQVIGAVGNLSSGVFNAINPQIIKQYSI
jgi:O-antigen/teichoic acid export membrane protein